MYSNVTWISTSIKEPGCAYTLLYIIGNRGHEAEEGCGGAKRSERFDILLNERKMSVILKL